MILADRFDGFLLDLDGVVWRGERAIAGAAETIDALRNANKRVVFVTNNASRSPRDYAAKLMRLLIPTGPSDVVTSAHVVVSHLRSIGLRRGDRVHVCAAAGLADLLRTNGFVPTNDTDDVDALVVAWNRALTFDDIKRAADVARSDVPFVAANRDATYPDEEGLLPGSGAILAAVETASGRRAIVVGKPEPELVLLALERAGTRAERSLFVGDRPDTDVAGARAAGVPVALVLSGVTTRKDVGSLEPEPDWVLDDLSAVLTTNVDEDPRPEPSGGRADVVFDEPGLFPASTEGNDERHPGDEAADVREVRNAAALGLPDADAGAEQL
jgi:4-nitrophenyl phosphatase